MKTLMNTVRFSASHYISPHNANYRAIIAQYLGMGLNSVPYLYLRQWRHNTWMDVDQKNGYIWMGSRIVVTL